VGTPDRGGAICKYALWGNHRWVKKSVNSFSAAVCLSWCKMTSWRILTLILCTNC
jgi:hypothetical protein